MSTRRKRLGLTKQNPLVWVSRPKTGLLFAALTIVGVTVINSIGFGTQETILHGTWLMETALPFGAIGVAIVLAAPLIAFLAHRRSTRTKNATIGSREFVRLKRIVREHLYARKGSIMIAVLCLIVVAIMDLLAPWPLKILFDNVLLEKPLPPVLGFLTGFVQSESLVPLLFISGSIVCIASIGAICSYLQVFISTNIGYRLTHILRTEMFSQLQQLSLSFHDKSRSGELLTKVSGDTGAVRDLFAEWALAMVVNVMTLIGMIVIMVIVNWQLSIVAIASLPVLLIVLFSINRNIKASVRTQRKQEGMIASIANEVLASISLIQAFGREEYEDDRFAAKSAENLSSGIRTARLSGKVKRIVAMLNSFGIAGTVLYGSWLVLQGQLTPGDLLLFIVYVNNFYKPVRYIGSLSAKLARATVSAQRIGEILELEPEIRDDPDAIQASDLRGEIIFENVSFDYANGAKALDNTSFHIVPGQRIALVGASGAGKSTIVSLILRLYSPQQGTILVDGLDIKRYQRASLRREIGIVLQDVILFGASVAENLSYGKPDASTELIEEAARLSHAHDFISAMPNSYETILGERGSTLSGGQRQRLCLARAIIKHPSILILDEPTSAIDSVSASLINDTIVNVQSEKTTLVISHQLSAMENFDQILVLKNGTIVEHGYHDQLLSLDGYYSQLFKSQHQLGLGNTSNGGIMGLTKS